MDDFNEYEGSEYQRPVHRLRKGLNVNELVNGVEFEVDENDQDQDLEENSSWWTNDKIIQHLKNNEELESETNTEEFRNFGSFDDLLPKMTPLTDDNGVFKYTIRNGIGPQITENTSIIYHCEAYLEAVDEPFDSTILRGRPFKHRLNKDPIIHGLLIALQTMHKFEKAYIIIYPNYAFGELGCPPRIPGNAAIFYRVEIINVFDEGTLAEYDTLTDDERKNYTFDDVLKMCNEERVSGNSYFKNKKYKEAAYRYRQAIQVLERYTYTNAVEQNQANEILLKIYSNAANSFNKIQKPIAAMSYCKRALAINPVHLKALYQYGVAKLICGSYDLAKEYLMKAKNIEPNNESIAKQLNRLEERVKLNNLQEKDLYTKMGSLFNSNTHQPEEH